MATTWCFQPTMAAQGGATLLFKSTMAPRGCAHYGDTMATPWRFESTMFASWGRHDELKAPWRHHGGATMLV